MEFITTLTVAALALCSPPFPAQLLHALDSPVSTILLVDRFFLDREMIARYAPQPFEPYDYAKSCFSDRGHEDRMVCAVYDLRSTRESEMAPVNNDGCLLVATTEAQPASSTENPIQHFVCRHAQTS